MVCSRGHPAGSSGVMQSQFNTSTREGSSGAQTWVSCDEETLENSALFAGNMWCTTLFSETVLADTNIVAVEQLVPLGMFVGNLLGTDTI